MNRLLLTFLLVLVTLPAVAQRRITPREYIDKYKHLAIADMEKYGIPASVKMAQALLESDAGNSRLALQGNNHFGIKCKSTWQGETLAHDDDAPDECFRKYGSAEESFSDHAEFLSTSARYEPLFTLDPMDYKAWAHGLKDCGYATNPQYAQLLVKMIETHELYRLDTGDTSPALAMRSQEKPAVKDMEEVVQNEIDPDKYTVSTRSAGGRPVYHNNGSEYVEAHEGDTYEVLSAATGIRATRLRKLNDAGTGMQPAVGEHVYLRPKASRALNGYVTTKFIQFTMERFRFYVGSALVPVGALWKKRRGY